MDLNLPITASFHVNGRKPRWHFDPARECTVSSILAKGELSFFVTTFKHLLSTQNLEEPYFFVTNTWGDSQRLLEESITFWIVMFSISFSASGISATGGFLGACQTCWLFLIFIWSNYYCTRHSVYNLDYKRNRWNYLHILWEPTSSHRLNDEWV